MGELLDAQIRVLADDAREYCRLPQSASRLRFVLDHVIARQHGGDAALGNFALRPPRPDFDELRRVVLRSSTLSSDRRGEGGGVIANVERRSFADENGQPIEITLTTIAVLAINQPSQQAVRPMLRREGA
jgi:hypothetical protein